MADGVEVEDVCEVVDSVVVVVVVVSPLHSIVVVIPSPLDGPYPLVRVYARLLQLAHAPCEHLIPPRGEYLSYRHIQSKCSSSAYPSISTRAHYDKFESTQHIESMRIDWA